MPPGCREKESPSDGVVDGAVTGPRFADHGCNLLILEVEDDGMRPLAIGAGEEDLARVRVYRHAVGVTVLVQRVGGYELVSRGVDLVEDVVGIAGEVNHAVRRVEARLLKTPAKALDLL
ncbi:MAG: hypothetical protein GEU75_10020 [Dehalococcoidia bacterium]|nr:hypothetical protein [Dehalococcoidia bacterium]